MPRVKESEDIFSALNRIPFLKQFYMQEGLFITLKEAIERVNRYVGYEFLINEPLRLEKLNQLLEIAYKRGDIK